MRLGDASGPQQGMDDWGDRNFRLAGTFVAFERFDTGQDTAQWRVRVVDLRSGRVAVSAPTGAAPSDTGLWLANGFGTIVGAGPTTALVVTPAGGVAWIVDDQFYLDPVTGRQLPSPERYREIGKADASGAAVLDAGTAVDPTILVVSGGLLKWVDNGMLRTAIWSAPRASVHAHARPSGVS